jgi:hypothetical protein
MNCASTPLLPPKVVAIAHANLGGTSSFQDPANLPGVAPPAYGQDLTSGLNRAAPGNKSVGTTEAELKPKMQKLLGIFASSDKSGMASRLVAAFLAKQSVPVFFEDRALNAAAASHKHIEFFMSCALSAPNSPHKSVGKIRIHQALKAANWDIKKLVAPADLGVPAFNDGSKLFSTGDFNNGLGLMINGVQHAFALATHYNYDGVAGRYCITLKFVFYDVFGLDDQDLLTFGATSDSMAAPASKVGITAWWQLQHQFGFAPLVTRIIIQKTFEAPAT